MAGGSWVTAGGLGLLGSLEVAGGAWEAAGGLVLLGSSGAEMEGEGDGAISLGLDSNMIGATCEKLKKKTLNMTKNNLPMTIFRFLYVLS